MLNAKESRNKRKYFDVKMKKTSFDEKKREIRYTMRKWKDLGGERNEY